ncbi:NifU family protein [Bacillus nitroreducens]
MLFLVLIDFFQETDYNNYKGMRKESIVMAELDIKEQVQEVLDKLRPFLLRDGGDCDLVDVEDGVVKLRLLGACGTCPSSTITLKAGIERALLEEVPGVVEVEQVF